jgi:hypothetical protein
MDGKAAFTQGLAKLEHLLKHLPSQLLVLMSADLQCLHLLKSLDKGREEDVGTQGAANCQLKLCFLPDTHVPNEEGLRILKISEHSPMVEELILFLCHYYSADKGVQYMQKWLDDLIKGAEHCYAVHKKV